MVGDVVDIEGVVNEYFGSPNLECPGDAGRHDMDPVVTDVTVSRPIWKISKVLVTVTDATLSNESAVSRQR